VARCNMRTGNSGLAAAGGDYPSAPRTGVPLATAGQAIWQRVPSSCRLGGGPRQRCPSGDGNCFPCRIDGSSTFRIATKPPPSRVSTLRPRLVAVRLMATRKPRALWPSMSGTARVARWRSRREGRPGPGSPSALFAGVARRTRPRPTARTFRSSRTCGSPACRVAVRLTPCTLIRARRRTRDAHPGTGRHPTGWRHGRRGTAAGCRVRGGPAAPAARP
jgi:hypothetical protein